MTYKISVIAILCLYMTALIGMITPSQQAWYLSYMPYFLLFNFALLFAYAEKKASALAKYAVVAVVGVFLIELVTTNLLGSTIYGSSLGFKLGGVPLIIGVWWFSIGYGTSYLAHKLPLPSLLQTAISTALGLGLFFIINLSAAKLKIWQINSSQPLLSWLSPIFILILLSFLFTQKKLLAQNKIAIYVYGGFLVFFVAIGSFLK